MQVRLNYFKNKRYIILLLTTCINENKKQKRERTKQITQNKIKQNLNSISLILFIVAKLVSICKGCFPVGRIFRTQRNFSLFVRQN